jgi:hypothetical protein
MPSPERAVAVDSVVPPSSSATVYASEPADSALWERFDVAAPTAGRIWMRADVIGRAPCASYGGGDNACQALIVRCGVRVDESNRSDNRTGVTRCQ